MPKGARCRPLIRALLSLEPLPLVCLAMRSRTTAVTIITITTGAAITHAVAATTADIVVATIAVAGIAEVEGWTTPQTAIMLGGKKSTPHASDRKPTFCFH